MPRFDFGFKLFVFFALALSFTTGCPSSNQNSGGGGSPGCNGGPQDPPPSSPPAPTAVDDSYTTSTSPLMVASGDGVLANDTTTPPATVTDFDANTALGGTVVVAADGGFTYTAPPALNAQDSFTYTVTDAGGTAVATVRITGSLPPAARDDSYSTSAGLLTIAAADGVLANDTVRGAAEVTRSDMVTSSGGFVTVSPEGGFMYIPPAGLNAIDAFTYTVTDTVSAATATVRITATLPEAGAPTGTSAPSRDGTDGDDLLEGGPDDDTINGLAGNDTIIGVSGNDILNGEFDQNGGVLDATDNDVLIGNDGGDRLVGDVGFNAPGATVNRMGDDLLDGGPGADTLLGDGVIDAGHVVRSGDDTIYGGTGDDQIYADFQIIQATGSVTTCGNDLVLGGDGLDILVGDVFTQNGTVGAMGHDTLKGGRDADTLYGDAVATSGSVGAFGNDTLEGGEGDDALTGDSESITSGGGADAFVFSIVEALGADEIRDYRSAEGDVIRFTSVTDADANGTFNRADLDALVAFAVDSNNGNARVTMTRRGDSTVIGSITFRNILFAGQSSLEELSVTAEVTP